MYEELLFRFATWQGLPSLFPPSTHGNTASKVCMLNHQAVVSYFIDLAFCLIVRALLVWSVRSFGRSFRRSGVGAAAVVAARRLQSLRNWKAVGENT